MGKIVLTMHNTSQLLFAEIMATFHTRVVFRRSTNWKRMARLTASPHQCPVTSMELFAQLVHWRGFLNSPSRVVVWSTVVILTSLGGVV